MGAARGCLTTGKERYAAGSYAASRTPASETQPWAPTRRGSAECDQRWQAAQTLAPVACC